MSDDEESGGNVQLATIVNSVVSQWHSEEAFLSWQEQVARRLEAVRHEKYALVERIAHSVDILEQTNLEKSLALFLRNEALAQEHLSEMIGAHESIRRHFEIFCEGRHRQERAIVHLARIDGIPRERVQGDLWLFGKLLVRVYENSIGAKLKERDETYLEGFTAYCNGTHEYQKEIESLARTDGVKLDGVSEQERYSAFVHLVRERNRLELVRKGLGIRSAEEQVREARAATAVEKKKREEFESRARKLEEDAGQLRRQASEKELSAQRERERIARRRQQVREQVREVRQEEAFRAKKGDEVRFHPEYGGLIAEAWIRLRQEVEEGEWLVLGATERKAASEYYFFQIIDEMTATDDFEEKYLTRPIQQVIDTLNQFFEGARSYGEVIERARYWNILTSRVDSWLGVDFRRIQRNAFHKFERKKHPYQNELEGLFSREFKKKFITLEEWIELWNRMPGAFVGRIDDIRKERYNETV